MSTKVFISFLFRNANTNKKKTILALGYMQYPSNYSKLKNEIKIQKATLK